MLGGQSALVAKLEQMVKMTPSYRLGGYDYEIHEMTEMARAGFGNYAHCNQPVHHALYLFTHCGEPAKTRHWTHQIMRRLYSPDTLPGDEDNGEMSAWYLFSAMGLYPMCPGRPEYTLGCPLVERTTIHWPDQAPLVIEAHAPADHLIRDGAVYHDDQPLPGPTVAHPALMRGGTLAFTPGAAPRQTRSGAPRRGEVSPVA